MKLKDDTPILHPLPGPSRCMRTRRTRSSTATSGPIRTRWRATLPSWRCCLLVDTPTPSLHLCEWEKQWILADRNKPLWQLSRFLHGHHANSRMKPSRQLCLGYFVDVLKGGKPDTFRIPAHGIICLPVCFMQVWNDVGHRPYFLLAGVSGLIPPHLQVPCIWLACP